MMRELIPVDRYRNRRTSGLGPPIRALLGVLGVAIFAAGVAAVFGTNNGVGAAALLAIGAGFASLGVLGDRIQSVEFGGVNLTLRDLARETFALANEAERGGDVEKAERLRIVGQELQDLASAYRRIRSSMRSGQERTAALEKYVMREAAKLAQSGALKPTDVSMWFDQGTPETRITALGLMEGNREFRDFDVALDAIEHSRSAFEQYHGLRLAEMMVPELTGAQPVLLRLVVQRALNTWRVRRSSDRTGCGRRILAALDDHRV